MHSVGFDDDGLLLTADGEHADHLRHHLRPDGIVDEPLFSSALHEAGPTQHVEVVRERGARNLELCLDLSHRQLPPRFHQVEEDVEPSDVGEGLESRDKALFTRLQASHGDSFHNSKYIEAWNLGQAKKPDPDTPGHVVRRV
jgi:hypothetical protein